jgi:hypothetical protein
LKPNPDENEVMRVRLIYEKRGGACFVPHVALASLFTRVARRAGVRLCPTGGFSPRARISFGPELPAGVVALCEPVDLWIKEREKKERELENRDSENRETEKNGRISDDLVSRLNAQMPEGFRVKKCLFPAEGAPALGRECGAAHYLIWERNPRSSGDPAEDLLDRFKNHFGEAVLFAAARNRDDGDKRENDSRISAVLANPAQNGIGGWVKTLTDLPRIAGWRDLCVVRTALGRWDGARMKTLAGEDVTWL